MANIVILVEDDAVLRRSIAQTLSYEGLIVQEASAVITAKDRISADLEGVVLSDIRMDGRDGFDLLADVQSIDADLPVILLTGQGDVSMAVQAMRKGAFDFLEKPCHPEALLKVLKRALSQRRLTIENRKLIRDLTKNDLVAISFPGPSATISAFRTELRKLARLPINIHLWGEHGVGKSTAVSCICGLLGKTEDVPNLSLSSCDAKSFEWLDQDGHPAFVTFRNVELASPAQQDMLASFIRNHQETRIITTSDRALEDILGDGLSKELYFLISVAQIEVPTLWSRPEDVLPTFHRLLRQQAENLQLAVPVIDAARLTRITGMSWTGNIAELRQHALKVLLDLDALDSDELSQGLPERLRAYEKSILIDALRRHRGQAADAAIELNIPLKTLYDKLKRFGLKGGQFR